MRLRPTEALAAVLLAASMLQGCRSRGGGSDAVEGQWVEARALVERGELDLALDKLRGATDAEGLYLQGSIWVRKAEAAPLPTATATEFKREELQALDLLERAVVVQPDHAAAHRAIADLLAPHALVRVQQDAASRGARRGAAPTPVGMDSGPDASPQRTVREYALALQADPAGKEAAEGRIRFATGAGRLDDADAGFRELLKREPEKPEPFIRYGDFLVSARKDASGAIAQYSQALMWRPDDDATKAKIAEIYIALAVENVARREYAAAEQRLEDARRYVRDPSSPQALRIREQLAIIAQVRGNLLRH